MTKLNTAVLVFTMALSISATPLFGQNAPIAPSMGGIPSVLQPEGSGVDAVTGDLSSELEPLSLGEEVVGEDYFEDAGETVDPSSSVYRNRVFGISGLAMSRANYNDARFFDGGISSGQTTLEDRGGLEFFMTTRNSQGRGWEVRYFGLFEGSNSISETFFPSGATASLRRTGSVHNVELNYLRQAEGPLSRLGLSLNEVIYGLRYFQFNDALNSSSNVSSSFSQGAENSLFGLQFGRRLEKQLGHRLGFAGLGKIGMYNNHLSSSLAYDSGLAFGGAKDDIAFLGELDLAMTFTFKPNVRAKLGYRMLAATGLGIAEGQSSDHLLPAQTTDSNGELFIEGGYLGIEFVR